MKFAFDLSGLCLSAAVVAPPSCSSASLLKFIIDIREGVAVLVPHDEAGVVAIFDGPGRREAAGHGTAMARLPADVLARFTYFGIEKCRLAARVRRIIESACASS